MKLPVPSGEFLRRLEILRKRDPKNLSVLEHFMLLPEEEKVKKFAQLSDQEINRLLTDIHLSGRPDQQMPTALLDPDDDAPYVWLMNWGRGAGKTQSASGAINYLAETNPGIRIGIIGTTAAEVRDALLHGPSGLITTANPDFMPTHHASASAVSWPNGSSALTFSAEEPEALRSKQFHVMWLDELAKWRYQQSVWDQIPYICRLTWQPTFKTWTKPIIIIGTTPRPTKLIKELKQSPSVVTTTISSFSNAANLNSKTITELEKQQGTRLGRQEIFAELLDDNPNGVDGFTYEIFDETRITDLAQINNVLQKLVRIVVAIDPAVSKNKTSDWTGLVVAGRDAEGHGYLLEDKTMKGTPFEWANKAVELYMKYGANYIVGEVNQGGDMVETILRSVNKTIPFKAVHATRGKAIRAEPVGALYAQRKIHHLGNFPETETQMVEFNTDIPVAQQKSPDRMDAVVWAFTDLLVDSPPPRATPRFHVL